MPPQDAPSPTPSTTAGGKRSRGSTSGTGAARKRRKADAGAATGSGTPAPDGSGAGSDAARRPVNFGVGMVKGREDEWSEPADVKTKINFLDLPVEALYQYLEAHDLLPHWDVSPWSELPCTPRELVHLLRKLTPATANALYTIPPPPPVVPIHPSPKSAAIDVDATGLGAGGDAPEVKPDAGAAGADGTTGDDAENAGGDDDRIAPPTTRSKTAPMRQVSPSPPPTLIKRGVMTLSDVHAARAVLAEKANAHWAKGLGGGQNREGETIVNFLYKNKVGHNRLLRVYNPGPAPFV